MKCPECKGAKTLSYHDHNEDQYETRDCYNCKGTGEVPDKVELEAYEHPENPDLFIFNIIFLETGEIRQKRRSREWLMRRVFNSELKTWNKRWGDILELES